MSRKLVESLHGICFFYPPSGKLSTAFLRSFFACCLHRSVVFLVVSLLQGWWCREGKGDDKNDVLVKKKKEKKKKVQEKPCQKKTMGLKEDFDQAAKDALTLPASTTNDDKLVLYGLFKTATVGKPETSRPGIFDQKGRAKWDAWKKVEDKSKDEAMQDYILKVTQLKEA